MSNQKERIDHGPEAYKAGGAFITAIEWHPWGENMPEQDSDVDLLWWYPYENDMGNVHRHISQLNTSDSYYRDLYGHRDKEGNYLPGQYWAYAPREEAVKS